MSSMIVNVCSNPETTNIARLCYVSALGFKLL